MCVKKSKQGKEQDGTKKVFFFQNKKTKLILEGKKKKKGYIFKKM